MSSRNFISASTDMAARLLAIDGSYRTENAGIRRFAAKPRAVAGMFVDNARLGGLEPQPRVLLPQHPGTKGCRRSLPAQLCGCREPEIMACPPARFVRCSLP